MLVAGDGASSLSADGRYCYWSMIVVRCPLFVVCLLLMSVLLVAAVLRRCCCLVCFCLLN